MARQLTAGAAAAISLQDALRKPSRSPDPERPDWVQGGEMTWRSFTAGDYADKTVLMVECKGGGFQHLIVLDWGDFAGDRGDGRDDAEQLAKWLCHKVNR